MTSSQTPASADELREQLAAIEHERWAHWQRWMQGTQGVNTPRQRWTENGDLVIPAVLVKAWQRQIDTPYAELSENEKQSDRDQVDRYWPLIEAYIVAAYRDRELKARIEELGWSRQAGRTDLEIVNRSNKYAYELRASYTATTEREAGNE